jgi:hypothetical protein
MKPLLFANNMASYAVLEILETVKSVSSGGARTQSALQLPYAHVFHKLLALQRANPEI